MDIKTFRAPTTKEALSRISRELGPDAIIVDQRKIRDSEGGMFVEVIAAQRDTSTPLPEVVSSAIAILPFADMSAEGDQEYFCDGMAEEILNKLSKVEGLRVVARTSSFSFKGKPASIPEIGNKLNVSEVLEGSVRKAGDRLRITAQLVSAADGSHIWSDSYDRELNDIFELQDEIAMNIVNALKIKMGVKQLEKLGEHPTDNLEAYNLYLQGRYYGFRMYEGDLERSIAFFKAAIDLDPEYALAFTGLAEAYTLIGLWGFLPPKQAHDLAVASAKKALEIDESLSETHVSRAMVAFFLEWNWSKAEEEFRRAIELNRDNAQAYTLFATFLSVLERHQEAEAHIKKARELDPLSSFGRVCHGLVQFNARNYAIAEELYKSAVEADPSYLFAFYNLIYFYNATGEYEKAIECAEKALGLPGSPTLLKPFYALAQGMLGNKDEALKILDEFKDLSKKTYVSAAHFANIYFGLGDMDKVFEYGYKGIKEKVPMAVFLKGGPNWDALRKDPRFDKLMQEMGF